MSSSPLASTDAGPASTQDPASSSSFFQDNRVDPILRSFSSQSSHASLSDEASNVANILGHATRLARLDPASFPTVYNTPTHNFPVSQLALTPLLAQLIAMVNDLESSVTFLTGQIEILTSAQEICSATTLPPASSSLEASSRTSPVELLLSPPIVIHKRLLLRSKPLHTPHPLLLLSQPNQLSRKRNSWLSWPLVLLLPQTFLSFWRKSGMATQTHTPRATQTLHKPPSSSPDTTCNQWRPNSTPNATQPPHSFILALHQGS